MPTWDDLGRTNAIEANKRLDREREIYRAGEPTREIHQTVKDIKILLTEILEILRSDKND